MDNDVSELELSGEAGVDYILGLLVEEMGHLFSLSDNFSEKISQHKDNRTVDDTELMDAAQKMAWESHKLLKGNATIATLDFCLKAIKKGKTVKLTVVTVPARNNASVSLISDYREE